MARQTISTIASWIGAVAACALVAGCGGSSSKAASGSSASGTGALAFSKCVRAHGVPDFPDPGATISGPHDSIGGINIPPTIDTQSPAFQAAFATCRDLLPGFSNQGKPPITAAVKESLIVHAQCMRTHGVPAYSDPTFPPGGGIEIFQNSGVNPQSPAYQHAAAACGNR
jgi:hypothetical protein